MTSQRPIGAWGGSVTPAGAAMVVFARDFRSSVFGGVALACLGLAPPAAAIRAPAPLVALSIPDAWKACNARQLAAAERIAHCTTIIDYRHTKPDARALALTARGFGHIAQKDNDAALADFEARSEAHT